MIVGVTGTAATLTVAVPVLLPPEPVTMHESVDVPTEPTEKVIAAVPAPDVMAPLLMLHAYVAPDCATTEAARPVLPVVAFAGAVTVALGAALMVAQAVSVIDERETSVAVTLWPPAVMNVMGTPVTTPAVKTALGGRTAAGSLLVTTALPL